MTLYMLFFYATVIGIIFTFTTDILTGYKKSLSTTQDKLTGVQYLKLVHALSTDSMKMQDDGKKIESLHANIEEIYAFQERYPKFKDDVLIQYLKFTELHHEEYSDDDYYKFFDQVNHENYNIGYKAEILFSQDSERYLLGTLMTHYLPEFIISLGIAHNILEESTASGHIDAKKKAVFIEQNKLIHLSSEEVANIIALLSRYENSKNLQATMQRIFTSLVQLKEGESFELRLNSMHILVDLAEELNTHNTDLLEKLLKNDEKFLSNKIIYYSYLLIFITILITTLFLYFHRILSANIRKDVEMRELNRSLESKIHEEVEKNRIKDEKMFQQSRLAQMGEMISMIAHQWRQPLTAITATSSLLELKAKVNQLDNTMTQEKAKNISTYARHLSETIDDFRNFFKPNKVQTETSCNEIVESVLGMIEHSIINKNIQLHLELNAHHKFLTYSNELKQVVLNLIKNAEDILLENKIVNPYIKVITYQKDQQIIMEVRDNGGGIPEEIIDNIFDPYFSTKLDRNGTGLGLYMSKTIVEKHCNGSLSINNANDGAIFRVELNT